MQEEKYKEEGRTYSKRNQDLMKWKFLAIQTIKDTKFSRFAVKKMCCGKKGKSVAGPYSNVSWVKRSEYSVTERSL